jgi:hypothetical protein
MNRADGCILLIIEVPLVVVVVTHHQHSLTVSALLLLRAILYLVISIVTFVSVLGGSSLDRQCFPVFHLECAGVVATRRV